MENCKVERKCVKLNVDERNAGGVCGNEMKRWNKVYAIEPISGIAAHLFSFTLFPSHVKHNERTKKVLHKRKYVWLLHLIWSELNSLWL